MILKDVDESFAPSIGLMVLRARSLEIYARTHTKDPDRKKDPDFGVAQILSMPDVKKRCVEFCPNALRNGVSLAPRSGEI